MFAIQLLYFFQHLPGIANNIADAFSCEFYMSDEKLMSFLYSIYPNQMPSTFHLI